MLVFHAVPRSTTQLTLRRVPYRFHQQCQHSGSRPAGPAYFHSTNQVPTARRLWAGERGGAQGWQGVSPSPARWCGGAWCVCVYVCEVRWWNLTCASDLQSSVPGWWDRIKFPCDLSEIMASSVCESCAHGKQYTHGKQCVWKVSIRLHASVIDVWPKRDECTQMLLDYLWWWEGILRCKQVLRFLRCFTVWVKTKDNWLIKTTAITSIDFQAMAPLYINHFLHTHTLQEHVKFALNSNKVNIITSVRITWSQYFKQVCMTALSSTSMSLLSSTSKRPRAPPSSYLFEPGQADVHNTFTI